MVGEQVDVDANALATAFRENLKTRLPQDQRTDYTIDWVPRKGLDFEAV